MSSEGTAPVPPMAGRGEQPMMPKGVYGLLGAPAKEKWQGQSLAMEKVCCALTLGVRVHFRKKKVP